MTRALERFFDSYYRLRPVNATFTGVHDFDDRLPDWSPDGLARAIDDMRALRASLSGADTIDALRETHARDEALARSFLDVQIAEMESLHFQRANPSLAIGEAAFGIVSLITRPFAPAADRANAVAGRLDAVPAFLDGAQRSIDAGVPSEWRTKAMKECDGVERLLGDGLRRWLSLESLDDRVVRPAAERAAAAVDGFRQWLAKEATDAGPARYAAGPEWLDLLIARGHWCAADRRTLAASAHDALDDALAVLDRRTKAAAPGGWPEVQDRLTTAHPTAEGYLAAFQRVWDDCRSRAIEARLVTWPDAPIRYVPIPAQTRDAAPFLYYLFYRSPAPFDRLPVHDYVVTPIDEQMPIEEQHRRLRAANDSVIALNHVVHHGAIGHHVQNHYAYAGDSEIGRVAAVDCASRIGMFLGGTMAEGWACYATDLMDEVGFLTADESLAQQHTRARLLARAVVDISLHTGSMTFDDVVAFYRDRVGMSPDAARGEACKNSMFPATAIMYWLGTDGLHRLRRKAAGGSLRAFHDRTLSFDEATAVYRDRVGMPAEAARAEACKNAMFPGTALMYWLGTDGLHRLRKTRERAEGSAFTLQRFHDRVLSFGSIPVPLLERIW